MTTPYRICSSSRVAVLAGAMVLVGVGCLDSSGLGVEARDAGIDRSVGGLADAGKGGASGGDAMAAKDGSGALGGSSGAAGVLSAGGAPGAGGVTSIGGIGGSGGGRASGGGGIFSSGGASGLVGSGGILPTGGKAGSNGGAPSSGGKTGGSGSGGAAGPGGTGAASADAAVDSMPITSDASPDSRGAICGTRTCGANEYCCSPSCSLCTRIGGSCLDIVCGVDGGLTSDAGSCRAMPSSDARYCGGSSQPHAYLCTLAVLDAPCVAVRNGVLTDVYCCP